MVINDNAIRLRAYEIWESEGRPEGSERQNWERAAHELALAGAAEGRVAINEAAKAMKKVASRKAAQPKSTSRKAATAVAA